MGYKGKVLVIGQDDKEKCHPAPHHALSIFLIIPVDTMGQILEAVNDDKMEPWVFSNNVGTYCQQGHLPYAPK